MSRKLDRMERQLREAMGIGEKIPDIAMIIKDDKTGKYLAEINYRIGKHLSGCTVEEYDTIEECMAAIRSEAGDVKVIAGADMLED